MLKSHPVIKKALLISIFFHTALIIIGVAFSLIKSTETINYNFNWDSVWYQDIIENWYQGSSERTLHSPVFYPLFPLCIFILQKITFSLIPLSILGTILNFACTTVIIYYIIKICENLFPKNAKLSRAIIVLFLTFHSAFFLHCFYSEALLIALGLASYYCAIKRKWGTMSILLAFTTAVRLPGLLFLGLCGLEFLRAYDYKIKKIFNKNLLWFLIAPLGIILYMVYLWIAVGDPLAMFHTYTGSVWESYQVFNPNIFLVYIKYIQTFFTLLVSGNIKSALIDYALPLYSIFMILITSIYALVKKEKAFYPLAIFGFAAIIMFSLNSNLISVNRYALSAISQFFIIGKFYTDRRTIPRKILVGAFIIINLIICLGAYYGFITGEFVG